MVYSFHVKPYSAWFQSVESTQTHTPVRFLMRLRRCFAFHRLSKLVSAGLLHMPLHSRDPASAMQRPKKVHVASTNPINNITFETSLNWEDRITDCEKLRAILFWQLLSSIRWKCATQQLVGEKGGWKIPNLAAFVELLPENCAWAWADSPGAQLAGVKTN